MKLFLSELRIEISPVFSTVKVSNFFSLKSRTPRQITSNVVYKFTCLCDTSLTYIGKTKRHFGVRSLEHLDFTKDNPVSEVKSHIKSCNSCKQCNFENFEIMKKCKSDRDSKIYEAMFIKQELPKLNLNLFNKGSFVTLDIFYWCLSCVCTPWRLGGYPSRLRRFEREDSCFISSHCISLFIVCVIVGSSDTVWCILIFFSVL